MGRAAPAALYLIPSSLLSPRSADPRCAPPAEINMRRPALRPKPCNAIAAADAAGRHLFTSPNTCVSRAG